MGKKKKNLTKPSLFFLTSRNKLSIYCCACKFTYPSILIFFFLLLLNLNRSFSNFLILFYVLFLIYKIQLPILRGPWTVGLSCVDTYSLGPFKLLGLSWRQTFKVIFYQCYFDDFTYCNDLKRARIVMVEWMVSSDPYLEIKEVFKLWSNFFVLDFQKNGQHFTTPNKAQLYIMYRINGWHQAVKFNLL